MREMTILLLAHEVNENLGLGLTPKQIARTLTQYTDPQRPKRGRDTHDDPTASEAIWNVEGR